MNPEEVLAWAKEQLAGGVDPDAVNRVIADNTDYPNEFALRMAVESAEDFVESETLQEMAGGPVAMARGIGEGLLQGVSLNAIDEVLASANNRTLSRVGRSMSRRDEARREEMPGTAAALDVAGGLMVPAAGVRAAKTAAGGSPGIIPSALRGGAQGAAGGALAGSATGFFLSNPEGETAGDRLGERMVGARAGAVPGAIGGGLFGTVAGGVAGAFGGRGGRALRLGEEMVERTGRQVDDASKVNVVADIQATRQRVQDELYQPLDRMFPAIEDPEIQSIIQRAGGDPELRSRVFSNTSGIREMRPGSRRAGTGTQVTMSEMGQRPSFSNLQNLRSQMREIGFAKDGSVENPKAVALYRELSDRMEDILGPDFAQANRVWRRTHRQEEAVELGWKRWDSAFEDMIEDTRGLADDPEVIESFRRGRLARWQSQLSRSPSDTMKRLQNFVSDEGVDRRASIADMFPGGQESAEFQEFVRVATSELDAEARAEALRRILQSVAVGLSGGIVGGAIGARGNN